LSICLRAYRGSVVTDWTTIGTAAIAAGGAVLGAGLGYLGARLQALTELRKLQTENREGHLQHRQGVYHDFLDSAFRFHQDAGGIQPFGTVDAYRAWAHEFEHHLNAVSLFGTHAAWQAAQALADRIEDTMGVATPGAGYTGEMEDRFLAAYRATIEAMRPDTAPQV
jgi:hypothetical protein